MKRLTLLFAWFGSVLLIGCGGAQKVDEGRLTTCETDGKEIAEGESVCDTGKIGLFEIRVKKWEEDCKAIVEPTLSDQVAQKLTDSLGCTEENRALDLKKKECADRVHVLEAMKECADEKSCDALLKDLNTIISDCELLGKEETDLGQAKALKEATEARIAELALEAGLEQLGTQCTESAALAKKNRTDEALTQIIKAIADAPIEDAAEAEEEAVAELRDETFDNCREALKDTVGRHIKAIANQLKRRRVKKNAEKWMSYFRNLEGTSLRLREVGAESIYPEATDEIDKMLLDFDKLKNKIESQLPKDKKKPADEKKTKKSAGVEDPWADEDEKSDAKKADADEDAKKEDEKKSEPVAAAAPKVLEKGPERCERLKKEIKRIKGKIAEHEKKNNDKKVNAYTKKLNKVEGSLLTLEKELAEALQSADLDKDEKDAIKKDIESAGCSLDTASE